ncbi:hypothetical protein EUX98_g1193 [Antrodiella citrinella]|uniref:Enhancer of mRNA-decapping protein 4 WD40 repeat region domain-containing protein n=1 Tax=Antrodiella citrinella TaxID=2447956 RepID=A0A4S4N507_9APHY|nr:hypothetical protein EUX98_g1193 [Antrodiella citrinella]
MDPINNRDNLFSRGPSPPPQQHQQFHQGPPLQNNAQHVSPTQSIRELAQAPAATHLDHLFHNLTLPHQRQPSPHPSIVNNNVYAGPQEGPASGPATPASNAAGSSASAGSASNPTTDRQNALLSLLGSVTPQTNVHQPQPNNPQPSTNQAPPQQVPTPPGSAPRAGPSNSESQGKILLEQLMSGSGSKFGPDPAVAAAATHPLPGSGGPSPTYLSTLPDSHHDAGENYGGESTYASQSHENSEPFTQSGQDQQQQPPSPRRSMFEFVSPFDALTGSSLQPKRKPAQTQTSHVAGGSEDSWNSSAAVDPKRKSVENLMDQLTRGQAPMAPPPAQAPPVNPYDPYSPSDDPPLSQEPFLTRASRPLPPQPAQATSSPRSSPPKIPLAQRQQRRSADSPMGAPQGSYGSPSPNKDGSPHPSPAAAYRQPRNVPAKAKPTFNSQPQSIVFDVSQSLEEIQAPRDAVKSTAIALVRVDSTFLPGTTIGATHWVAYAMTKGRVRVISRSSGDRTLLQLPPLFAPTASVTDMSVHGNRLAGVTSDGGFVVWELPEVIRDDVPGVIALCVLPAQEYEPLRSVKWHPQKSDLVAVASDTNIYFVNIADAAHIFGGEPIPQAELHRVAQIFSVPSPIIAFDYDLPRSAIATISEDSTLTMWNIRDKLPFWSAKVRGDEIPSSLTFVEGGVVVGRKHGTIFQLLPIMGRNVLSTIKFVNGSREDADMFGHANYDSRIQTLWIANNRRDSMIAFKINFDVSTPSPGGEDNARGAYFEQVVEFVGPKPTIHFVILTADADPNGDEAHAACVAAKVPIGELALVAFSVHSTGVDQVLIRKEWFTSALSTMPSKIPQYTLPAIQPVVPEPKQQRQPLQQQQQQPIPQFPPGPPPPLVAAAPVPLPLAPPRIKTPPSDNFNDTEEAREDGRNVEGKGKGQKGRNVGWKDKEESSSQKDVKGKGIDNSMNEPLGVALTKEMRKVEENIHTRIGRLISKELDKQHQRLEDARANEQAADFVRQEKILKLISMELTKNTTRVVEQAVKAEVQNSVLPSLENIMKNEVKTALNLHIGKGLADAMKQNLPNEIEKLLLRPEISAHMAGTFSSVVTPIVERQVKDSIQKTLIPAYTQQSSALHQELSREIHGEILNLKKEVISWQSEALRGQESLIRELEQSVRLLADQVKYLSLAQSTTAAAATLNRSSPAPSTSGNLGNGYRHNLPLAAQVPQSYTQPQTQQHTYAPPPQQQQQQLSYGPWITPGNIAAPQASHPAAPPPVPSQSQLLRTTPPLAQSEEWDDTYLAVLGSQDSRQLRELLARSNPDLIMPLGGGGPLSQAVVLTLVHRLSQLIGEVPPSDESFKSSLWWLQRAATVLNTSDPLISPYVSRVMPSVQGMLNTTKQRLAILPGGPLMDTARAVSDIQDQLSRKPLSH